MNNFNSYLESHHRLVKGGMGHLSVLMRIKVYYNQNTFNVFRFRIADSLTYCASAPLLDNNFGKDKNHEINLILLRISIESSVRHNMDVK